MTYEEKEDSREVILVGYYNVLFYLIFRVGLDEYKKDILIERIRSGERMVMKDIYRWCEGHQVPFWTKFIYRKDFSVNRIILKNCRLALTHCARSRPRMVTWWLRILLLK